jgi:DNA-binding response OmpR family regulator
MKKLLVIENDVDTLEIIKVIFDGSFDVITSTNRLSINEIHAISPGIILIDYSLDDCFGSEICLEIKNNQSTKHIPVILFSTNSDLEEIAHDSYADAFIIKPFELDNMIDLVNKLANTYFGVNLD